MDGACQVRHGAVLAVRTTIWLRDEEALSLTFSLAVVAVTERAPVELEEVT
jgi:hypothetical protein